MERLVPTRSARANHLEGNILSGRVAEFQDHLLGLGYAARTIRVNVEAARHFAHWLERSAIELTGIDDEVIQQFSSHRCMWTYNRWHGALAPRYIDRVCRFVRFLGQSRLTRKGACQAALPVDGRVRQFQDWLRTHRGSAERTILGQGEIAARLVTALGPNPADYHASAIRQLITDESGKYSRAYLAKIASVLRSYLRFLSARGECRPWLDQAVPTFAEWRLSALPRYLATTDVERVVGSCDLSKPQGVRDRAILLLLARLGLRAGDICAMRLDDIDWTDGTLRVRGKGRRETRLPFPQDAGDALLEYLQNYRPRVPSDRVFLRLSAPHRPWVCSCAVSLIVDRALVRAGIENAPSRGANLLRHSAATTMLRSGASMDAVGSILRHRSPNTTAHYAKVDVLMLSQIAQPWLGGESC
ncbi:MAG: tyrosine-type recombinase/integrase [Defluviicoccus sp.]|jgi:site-specific recombinase XerD|nr:tyrosine-type recombinase/integrase [Defluviicoccus sp.]